jgi:hypothetical protein
VRNYRDGRCDVVEHVMGDWADAHAEDGTSLVASDNHHGGVGRVLRQGPHRIAADNALNDRGSGESALPRADGLRECPFLPIRNGAVFVDQSHRC